MSKKETKDYFKEASFKPSIQINFKQGVIIVLILVLILSTPFVYNYLTNPQSETLGEIAKSTVAGMKINNNKKDLFVITVPIANFDVDLTVIKQNPQLLVYGGVVFLFLAVLIGITLFRNLKD